MIPSFHILRIQNSLDRKLGLASLKAAARSRFPPAVVVSRRTVFSEPQEENSEPQQKKGLGPFGVPDLSGYKPVDFRSVKLLKQAMAIIADRTGRPHHFFDNMPREIRSRDLLGGCLFTAVEAGGGYYENQPEYWMAKVFLFYWREGDTAYFLWDGLTTQVIDSKFLSFTGNNGLGFESKWHINYKTKNEAMAMARRLARETIIQNKKVTEQYPSFTLSMHQTHRDHR